MRDADHYIQMAEIWFSHVFGNRSAVQRQRCERLGWYYLMGAIMQELQP